VKLAHVDLCGFRGFHKRLRIDFPDGFTIIDGRNGVGKSTIFDAVEFALTGTIAKYGDATAAGETIADYIWWIGEGKAPPDRYVEVGFRDGEDELVLRRTRLFDGEPSTLPAVLDRLCDAATMPKSPLSQLCAASIIRDEHIAALSLDLKETERYTLLRAAIGATDAEVWISRGSGLARVAERRTKTAENEVEAAAREVAAAARQIDEIRAGLVEESLALAAAARLNSFTGSMSPPDQVAEPARVAIAERSRQVEELIELEKAWQAAEGARDQTAQLRAALAAAQHAKSEADAALVAVTAERQLAVSADALTRQARDIAALVSLGRKLGLHDGHCPLCDSDLTEADFEDGLATAERLARELNELAVEQVAREQAREAAEAAEAAAQEDVDLRQRLLKG